MKREAGWIRKTADIRAYHAEWRKKNPARCRKYQETARNGIDAEARRANDKEKYYARMRKIHGAGWKVKSPMPELPAEEKRLRKNRLARDRKKRWLAAHPDIRKAKKCAQNGRRRATSKDGSFTSRDVTRILDEQGGLCLHCQQDIRTTYTVDHKHALSNGGSNKPENIQLLCFSCNVRKGNS